MRIIFLADTAATHTRKWATWFALRGHEVHIVSFNTNDLPGYESVVVHHLWSTRRRNYLGIRILKAPIIINKLRKIFRLNPPDIVHSHSAGGYAWAAFLSGFRPYVVTPWGTDLLVDSKASIINKLFTGMALRRAALVTTDGFHLVGMLRSFGVYDDRILVHTFGTDVDFFSPGPAEQEYRKLNISGGPVIVSTRTLNPVHDVETFIRAIPAIRSSFPSSIFIVVGDGQERSRLESLAHKLGISDAIRFTYMVNEDRMRSILRIANVYVSTSLMDAGLASSTGEAMSTSLPVVQTDYGDNAYWTPEGVGGYLFKGGDSDALSIAICRLLSNKELCIKMGIRNRNLIIEKYNIDTEMIKIEGHYSRIVNRTPC